MYTFKFHDYVHNLICILYIDILYIHKKTLQGSEWLIQLNNKY